MFGDVSEGEADTIPGPGFLVCAGEVEKVGPNFRGSSRICFHSGAVGFCGEHLSSSILFVQVGGRAAVGVGGWRESGGGPGVLWLIRQMVNAAAAEGHLGFLGWI